MLILFSMVTLIVWAWNIDWSIFPRTGSRLWSSTTDKECQCRWTRVIRWLGRAWDVALASCSLGGVHIRGNKLRLCICHWPCESNVPGVAWCCSCFTWWVVWLDTDRDTFAKGAPVVVMEQLSVSFNLSRQPKLGIHCACRNNQSWLFQQFTQVRENASH